MGFLGWPPSEFWDARVMDIMDAVDGAAMREGEMPRDIEAEMEAAKRAAALEELDRLMAAYPDKPADG